VTLQDAWRFRYSLSYGRDDQYAGQGEGLWLTPYPVPPTEAARDALRGLTRSFAVPGDADSYPLILRVVVVQMDSGTETGTAELEAVREWGDLYKLDGTELEKPTGHPVFTSESWTKGRR
jgi:hypothetical protein